MTKGLPDWQTGISVVVEAEAPDYPTEFVGRPTARVRTRGSGVTTTGSMSTIVSYAIPSTKYFVLAKILATWSGTDEQHIQVLLGSEIVGEYYATAYVIDWFAHHVKAHGGGGKVVKIQAQATATEATLVGILNGEEV